jgi:hypothetical protein
MPTLPQELEACVTALLRLDRAWMPATSTKSL